MFVTDLEGSSKEIFFILKGLSVLKSEGNRKANEDMNEDVCFVQKNKDGPPSS